MHVYVSTRLEVSNNVYGQKWADQPVEGIIPIFGIRGTSIF